MMMMDLVTYILPLLSMMLLERGMAAVCISAIIKYVIGIPTSFLVHKIWDEIFYRFLDLL